jgi:hypothetical protein
MTVQELIERLQKCPPGASVLFSEHDLAKDIDFVEHKIVESPIILPLSYVTNDKVFLQESEPDWEEWDDCEIEVIPNASNFVCTKYRPLVL